MTERELEISALGAEMDDCRAGLARAKAERDSETAKDWEAYLTRLERKLSALSHDNTETATPVVVFASRPTTPRLRVRRVDEGTIISSLQQDAPTHSDGWRVVCHHGGGVANSYRYQAETECLLGVRTPEGHVVVWMDRVPANKVTLSGAAGRCLPEASWMFDRRCNAESKARGRAAAKAAAIRILAERTQLGQALDGLAPGTVASLPFEDHAFLASTP